MPNVNLPMPTYEGTNDDKLKNLHDIILMYRKELDYLLHHLDSKNVLVAQRAEIADLYAGTIEANKITVNEGKITNAQIDTLSADKITAGTIKLSDSIIVENEDSSVVIDENGITVTDGKILVKNSAGTETILDAYGIDPRLLDYFKNMIWNSSFEVYDADTLIPAFWDGGVSDDDASFNGTYSMKLTPSESSMQTELAGVNPAWFENLVSRISFYSKFGQVKLEVYDQTNDNYFTLTDNSTETPVSGTSITFNRNANWSNSRCSAYFDPAETGHAGCTKLMIKFTNVHGSESTYIDAVQMTPDITGKWSQLYKDGQFSRSAAEIGDFTQGVENSASQLNLGYIYIQNDQPVTNKPKSLWVDTDDYSRYDRTPITTNTVDTLSSNEFVEVTTGGITFTLADCTNNPGIVRKILNSSTGIVTINGISPSILLYPGESVNLLSNSTTWVID